MPKLKKVTEHLDTGKRPTRMPIDGPRKLLEIPNPDPAYHYTWQPEGEVPRFLRAGYEYVTDPDFVGDPTVNKSSKIPGAPGNILMLNYKTTPLYALQQRIEWWDADQATMEKVRTDQELAMRPNKADGEYGQVKIGTELGRSNQTR